MRYAVGRIGSALQAPDKAPAQAKTQTQKKGREMSYVYKEFPKSMFRIDPDGSRRERVFPSADEVEPGWVDLADLADWPNAKPETPAPLSNEGAVSAGKRLVQAERDNIALKDTVKLYEDETKAKNGEIKALREALEIAREMIVEQGGEALEAPAKTETKPKRKRKA
jgi:hypothetical protein